MIETLILTLILLWSVYIVFKKVFPNRYTRTMTTLAQFCEKQGWHVLAKCLKPPMSLGCGGGCGCKADDTASSPVKWK